MRDLQHREHAVPPELHGSVLGIWELRGTCGEMAPHLVLPDGCMGLVLNFGSPLAAAGADGPGTFERAHSLVGEVRRPMRLFASGEVHLIGVRLAPGATLDLTRVPLPELVDRTAAQDVLTPRAHRLTGRLDSAAPDDRPGLLARGLAELAGSGRRPCALVQAAVSRIFQLGGQLQVEDLAAMLHVSSRTLQRRFLQEVGMSPKSLCEVLRFQAAVRLLGAGARDGAGAACAAGYFDQSHLIRDFRRFAGCTPSDWRTEAGLAATA